MGGTAGGGRPALTPGLPCGATLLVATAVLHDAHMALYPLKDGPKDAGHIVVQQRGGLAWIREQITALWSWASTVAGAELRFHDHLAGRPDSTPALGVHHLTPAHPNVWWHPAALNAGSLERSRYH